MVHCSGVGEEVEKYVDSGLLSSSTLSNAITYTMWYVCMCVCVYVCVCVCVYVL